MEKQTSLKMKRQRKFLLVLPLLALPFLTLFFWALGGGKGEAATRPGNHITGFDLQLPQPHFKQGKQENKLSYYLAADRDSAKLEQEIKSDPYRDRQLRIRKKDSIDEVQSSPYRAIRHLSGSSASIKSVRDEMGPDSNAIKVYQKLDQLKAALKENSNSNKTDVNEPEKPMGIDKQATSSEDKDITKLEMMIQSMRASDDGNDPEMQQLDDILNKIMAVQHPEMLKGSLDEQPTTSATKVYQMSTKAVKGSDSEENISSPDTLVETGDVNGFYSLNSNEQNDTKANTIAAEVRETQKLVNGATIKLYLERDIYLAGHLIPQSTPIYGTVTLNNDRLKVSVNSIIYEQSVYPVSLKAYDLDGLEGIYIPGSISRQALKEQAGQSVNGLGLNTLDNSLKAQAADAGIQAAKSFLSHKTRLETVTVQAGYQVLLKP